MYIRVIDGQPQAYALHQLRADNPQVSFPAEPPAECLADFGVYPVTPTERPAWSPIRTIAEGPAELVGGEWRQTWVETPLPLNDAKLALWSLAKAKREELTDAPGAAATTPFGLVQVDAKSKQNVNGLVTMALIAQGAGAPFSSDFTLADNSVVTLNAAQMIGLGVAVGQYVEAVYGHARTLRDAIEAAEDHGALEAIDAEAGWP